MRGVSTLFGIGDGWPHVPLPRLPIQPAAWLWPDGSHVAEHFEWSPANARAWHVFFEHASNVRHRMLFNCSFLLLYPWYKLSLLVLLSVWLFLLLCYFLCRVRLTGILTPQKSKKQEKYDILPYFLSQWFLMFCVCVCRLLVLRLLLPDQRCMFFFCWSWCVLRIPACELTAADYGMCLRRLTSLGWTKLPSLNWKVEQQ